MAGGQTYRAMDAECLVDVRHDPVVVSGLCAGGQVRWCFGRLVHEAEQSVGVVDALCATHVVPVHTCKPPSPFTIGAGRLAAEENSPKLSNSQVLCRARRGVCDS